MFEKVKMKINGIPRAGEHRAKNILIEGLERIPEALYYLVVQATDGETYELKIPDDANHIPIDASMAPVGGIMKTMLEYKNAAGDVLAKSDTETFVIEEALVTDDKTLPSYEAVKTLSERILEVPGEIEKMVGTVDSIKEAGEAAKIAAALAIQAAKGAVPDGSVGVETFSGVRANLFDKSAATTADIQADGTALPSAGYLCTGFIPVRPGSTYTAPAGVNRRIALYGADKTFLRYIDGGTSVAAMPIIIPNDILAAWLRVSYYIVGTGLTADNFMICIGGEYYSNYIPYGETYVDWLVNAFNNPENKRILNSVTQPIDEVNGNNLLPGWAFGALNGTTGEESVNAQCVRSDFIPVENDVIYYFSGVPTAETMPKFSIMQYTEDKTFIIRLKSVELPQGYFKITDPECKFVRLFSLAFETEGAAWDFVINGKAMLSLMKDAEYEPYEKVTKYGVPYSAIIDPPEIPKVTAPNALPDYYEAEIQDTVEKIFDMAENDAIVFPLITDVHYDNEVENVPLDRQFKAMRKIVDNSICDFAVMGGDLLTGGDLPVQKKIVEKVCNMFSGARVPLLMCKGDHDQNLHYWESKGYEQLSCAEWAKRVFPYMPGAVRMNGYRYGNSFYFDLPEKKARFISIDNATPSSVGGKAANGYLKTSALYKWLVDEAFSDDIKDGYRIVVFAHIPVDGTVLNTINKIQNTRTLCEACNANTAWAYDNNLNGSSDSESSAAAKDFTGWTSKVVLVNSGHIHCDRLEKTANGLPFAVTGTADSFSTKTDDYYAQYAGTSTTVEKIRTLDTIQEALFDVFIINADNIKVIRFGAGSDKTLNLTAEQEV